MMRINHLLKNAVRKFSHVAKKEKRVKRVQDREGILGEDDKKYEYSKVLYWNPSDQSKAVDRLKEKVETIDAVIEVRDARIPIASINPRFTDIFKDKRKLVVYNKVDLASEEFNWRAFSRKMNEYVDDTIMSVTMAKDRHVDKIITWSRELMNAYPHLYPTLCIAVVGPPNVGKSTLINKLRHRGINKKMVLPVGNQAGLTRSVQMKIKIVDDPAIYIIDTPGIFEPHFSHPINGLKLALVGALKDSLIDPVAVVEYLIYKLNNDETARKVYMEKFKLKTPAEQVIPFLKNYASQMMIMNKARIIRGSAMPDLRRCSGLMNVLFYEDVCSLRNRVEDVKYNIENTALEVIRMYRLGELGRITLDECSNEVIAYVFSEGDPAKTLTMRRFDGNRDKTAKKKKKRPVTRRNEAKKSRKL